MTKNQSNSTTSIDNEQSDKLLWGEVSDTVKLLKGKDKHNAFKDEIANNTKPANRQENQKQLFKTIIKIPFIPTTKSLKNTFTPHKKLTHSDSSALNKSHAKKFREGKLDISDKLDLHGKRKGEAHSQVNEFIKNAYDKGFRNVKIITGKGKGILQSDVPDWLNNSDLRSKILAFKYAQNHHGGLGALYVVLKRKSK